MLRRGHMPGGGTATRGTAASCLRAAGGPCAPGERPALAAGPGRVEPRGASQGPPMTDHAAILDRFLSAPAASLPSYAADGRLYFLNGCDLSGSIGQGYPP